MTIHVYESEPFVVPVSLDYHNGSSRKGQGNGLLRVTNGALLHFSLIAYYFRSQWRREVSHESENVQE